MCVGGGGGVKAGDDVLQQKFYQFDVCSWHVVQYKDTLCLFFAVTENDISFPFFV